MINHYDRVDIEAARFRMALLEDVGDPVDDLTIAVASMVPEEMVPEEHESSDSNVVEPIILEGVFEVPESLMAQKDLVTSKVTEISDFAGALGVSTRFKLEDSRDVVDGKHAAKVVNAPTTEVGTGLVDHTFTHEVLRPDVLDDVVEVRSGYTRGYPRPTELAVPRYKKHDGKLTESIKAVRGALLRLSDEEVQAQAAELKKKQVTLTVKAGETGRLFAAIKTEDVAKAVAAAGLGRIGKRKIELLTDINSVGKYTANVRLDENIVAVVNLNVVADK